MLASSSSHQNNNSILSKYTKIQSLGTGVDGEVLEVEDVSTGQRRAMKTVNLKRYANCRDRKLQAQSLVNEIGALRQLDHPNVVRILDLCLDAAPHRVVIIMDLCLGGTLTKAREERVTSPFAARAVLHQVLRAVLYLHARGLAHRDIKPDNIMFSSASPDSLHVCLIDFGVTKKPPPVLLNGGTFSRMQGTPYYMSPQVVQKKYGLECDLWSVGVLAYLLLTQGQLPFDAPSVAQLFTLICTQEPDFAAHTVWSSEVSGAACLLLVRGLLDKDARRRLTAAQALASEWFVPLQFDDDHHGGGNEGEEHVVADSLGKFGQLSALDKMTRMVLSHQSSATTELLPLRERFSKLDADGSGHLDVDELAALLSGEDAVRVAQVFAALDVDASGHVQLAELSAAAAALLDANNNNSKALLAAFDFIAQGTDHITVQHVKALLGGGGKGQALQHHRQLVAAADVDGDGKLSKHEFLSAVMGTTTDSEQQQAGGI